MQSEDFSSFYLLTVQVGSKVPRLILTKMSQIYLTSISCDDQSTDNTIEQPLGCYNSQQLIERLAQAHGEAQSTSPKEALG